MTWFGNSVDYKSGRTLDAFGWLRTGTRNVAFEYSGHYDQGLLLWEHSLSGTGSVTFESTTGGNILSTGGTASGAKAIRQSHEYHLYLPGRSRLAVVGFLFGATATNLRRRVGLFDADNGAFLEQTSSGISFVTRSNISGSPVDSPVAQASWNLDKLDGTGASGITIDVSKANALIIDWVGYNLAKIRFGFLLGGRIVYAHEVENLNAVPSFSFAGGDLPVRYEIENTGITSGTNTMKASSCVVYNEDGSSDEVGYQFSANTGTTAKSITTRAPIISFRPKVTFNSLTNRGHLHLTNVELMAKTNDLFFEVVRNGTLTGAAYVSAGSNSIAEYDITASAISGGDILYSGYVPAGSGSKSEGTAHDFIGRLALTNDFAGTSPDRISIVGTSMSGTSSVSSSVTWSEQR